MFILGENIVGSKFQVSSRDFVIQDDVIVVTKQMEERINKNDLLASKANILEKKERLRTKNIRLINEYNELLEHERCVDEMMEHLSIKTSIDVDELKDELKQI